MDRICCDDEFVDCVHTCAISQMKPISGRSLRHHILSLCDILKETTQTELPSRFAVVFDSWTGGTHHYIGIAALFIEVVDGRETACQIMLIIQPLLADGIIGTEAVDHIEHLLKVLLSYGKSCANIVCLDALATNSTWLCVVGLHSNQN